ncbi:MAG: D-amino acid aminotransferase [Candidatus Muproteobacteria bacterium RBG_16_64_10]|uniref:D-amino acid aminotransferase n=1 Tax=Candidatus Muproteobacteria bacterium RBG_16_64_10 TaxID=1817757 RepID=A0A1F6T1L0_9PROT|nr:MAG: D-amino acid aminotransferase [Candidatus Muproteobacteria bacterium RBG_16_64_10]
MTQLPDLPLVYLNGAFLPPADAQVSAFDRGFIFGDGVYEVIPVFGGRLFRLPHHLARLDHSLQEIHLHNPLTPAEWRAIFQRLVEAVPSRDQYIYLQITRGVAPRDHAFPAQVTPTVFAYSQPLKTPPAEQIENGITAVTLADIRWRRCDIKAIALLANAMLRSEAIGAGAAEAILVRDGFMTEGSASNIFVVKNGELVTPPKGPFILPGITRDLVLELAATHRVPHRERSVREEDLYSADELWLTSSTKEILPITRLNGKPVGDGKPGPLHARLLALYREYKRSFAAGRAE